MKNQIKKIIPYLIILIVSLCGTYILFYDGLNHGDDFRFHFPNIMEQYETILKTHSLSPISGIVGNGLGSGTRLFYNPLPHLSVTILALFYRLYGGSVMAAYKTVLVLSIYLSGIFMYRFALHMSKNKVCISLLTACFFVLYPYRLFDAFCRIAYAEAFSIMFLPLFFMGLYDIVHLKKDEIKMLPFIEVIFGGGFLFLSHTITAFYAYIAGIIYLLCHIVKIVKLFKCKHFALYCIVSMFLLAGMGSIVFMSQFELLHTKIYTINDAHRMWSDIEHIRGSTHCELDYSGFLNITFLINTFQNYIDKTKLIMGVLLYIIAFGVFVIVDLALRECKKISKFHLLFSIPVLYIIVSLFSRRIEIYLATTIVLILYVFILYANQRDFEQSFEDKKVYKSITCWYCIGMLILLLFMMESPILWEILPTFMYKIQFPWRLWALVQVILSMLFLMIAQHFSIKKTVSFVFVGLVGALLVTNEPLIEKRLVYETHVNGVVLENNNLVWHDDLDESLFDAGTALGYQKEYCPVIFVESNYQSQYKNSLYRIVRPRVLYDTNAYEDYSIDPVFLTGKGKIEVLECFAPVYDMNIEVSQEAIIQMPLIYYPGYEIQAIDENQQKIILKGENIDGLVSFTLKEGKYVVKTNYVSTPIRKISVIWFTVSLTASCILLVYALKKEKKLWSLKKLMKVNIHN